MKLRRGKNVDGRNHKKLTANIICKTMSEVSPSCLRGVSEIAPRLLRGEDEIWDDEGGGAWESEREVFGYPWKVEFGAGAGRRPGLGRGRDGPTVVPFHPPDPFDHRVPLIEYASRRN